MNEPGTFIWNELVTPDQQIAGTFYSELFGWDRHEVDAGPLGTYTLFRRNGQDVAGMMNPTPRDYAGSPPPRWIGYIAVADVDAIAGHVRGLGGTVLEEPHDIPEVGRICMFTDPTGALVYVMQPQASSEQSDSGR
ncbi:VOC family protein [Arthrobacter sp. U41]|uniref:VOC family protein n=1 Tax=Arthrobacter sp. U41 TaxID=1849032 RepID=UPI0008595104|nr:VOC family protein [Arthrobacter sp. U41]AOT04924.1 glyoxalase [Arthrobacter sp. U41]